MSQPSDDPSIEHEPHLKPGGFAADPGEAKARRIVDAGRSAQTENDRVEHTVWDEPGLSSELAGEVPAGSLTYAAWLEKRIQGTTFGHSWRMALLIAAAAGPWALFGALTRGGQSFFGILILTIFAPAVEEMMKVAAPLWVIEKRPYLFRSRVQIALCVLASGCVFAAIENVLYLNVYIAEPSDILVRWRWTAGMALHMGCSFVAGLGLMRIWSRTIRDRTMPMLSLGAPYMVIAMVIHGTYNAFALVVEMFDFQI